MPYLEPVSFSQFRPDFKGTGLSKEMLAADGSYSVLSVANHHGDLDCGAHYTVDVSIPGASPSERHMVRADDMFPPELTRTFENPRNEATIVWLSKEVCPPMS